MNDIWMFRADGLRCATCMWYVQKRTIPVAVAVGEAIAPPPLVGRCRRHAPSSTGYPVVFANDWCGDHKLDENKINPAQKSVSAA